jgi:nucleoside-diphosphate-sugar epimerase
MTTMKQVLVVGANGRTGRAVVQALLDDGHAVCALVRHELALPPHPQLRVVRGSVLEPAHVQDAVQGVDAVVVVVGIHENPVRVRLFGARHTANDVRSRGTRTVVNAMQAAGVQRLVVQTTYGVGESFARLSLAWKVLFWAVLKPQIADTALQEDVVKSSTLHWVLVRPVGIVDRTTTAATHVSAQGDVASMVVERSALARVLARAATHNVAAASTWAVSTAQ